MYARWYKCITSMAMKGFYTKHSYQFSILESHIKLGCNYIYIYMKFSAELILFHGGKGRQKIITTHRALDEQHFVWSFNSERQKYTLHISSTEHTHAYNSVGFLMVNRMWMILIHITINNNNNNHMKYMCALQTNERSGKYTHT